MPVLRQVPRALGVCLVAGREPMTQRRVLAQDAFHAAGRERIGHKGGGWN